jgi:hypothetical protein
MNNGWCVCKGNTFFCCVHVRRLTMVVRKVSTYLVVTKCLTYLHRDYVDYVHTYQYVLSSYQLANVGQSVCFIIYQYDNGVKN